MLVLFTEITKPLTYEDKSLVRPMIRGLMEHIGQENAITSKEIIKGFASKEKWKNYKLTGVRVRRIIHHIRVNGLAWGVCSCSRGYYIAANKKELKDNCTSLRQRISSMKYALEALESQYIERYEENPV